MNETIRALAPDDWQAFRTIRLEALKSHPGVFSSNYGKESNYGEEDWRGWLSQKGKCVFGLFDGADLIGITGVFTHGVDPSGKTAVLGASYIKPPYRGRGLSELLYKARIEWAVGYTGWNKIVVAHRDGNEPSRKANRKWGFRPTHKDTMIAWPDGTAGDQYWYELDLEELRKTK